MLDAPHVAVFDCRMLEMLPTSRQPMRGYVDRIKAMEGKDGILSVSLAHGFPWGDTPEVGMRVLVVADGDAGKAAALAPSASTIVAAGPIVPSASRSCRMARSSPK